MSCALHAVKFGLKVRVLDARGLADGATGRNGGHSWPEPAGRDEKMLLESEDQKAVKTYVATLSEDWQKKIEMRKAGGIDLIWNDVDKNYYNYLVE